MKTQETQFFVRYKYTGFKTNRFCEGNLAEITSICRLDNGMRMVSIMTARNLFGHAAIKEALSTVSESEQETGREAKEVFNGKTVWDGIVEVFELHGHPKANIAYAWSHATDDPENPKRHVTVLQVPPAVSPLEAVRVAILQELKELRANAEPEAEAS